VINKRPRTPRIAAQHRFACLIPENARYRTLGLALRSLVLVLLASPVLAHVQLDDPNGGEVLTAGDQIEVRWHVLIQHNLDNWDLWYSTDGDGGPWIPIATDLPAGDGTPGAMQSHLWTVPDEDSGQVRVRVRQDNLGTDYLDISDADLTILPSSALFADGFESGDTGAWNDVVP